VEDRTRLTYEKRSEYATNAISKLLFNIIATKKTNLCLSIDLTSSASILQLIEKVGEHVCMVKTHVDIIEDFNADFIMKLKLLAERLNFVILEDRKYADIGNTVSLQYLKGIYKVAEWADCVTVHSLPGEGILKAINSSGNGISSCGVFLLAEMSSEVTIFSKYFLISRLIWYPGQNKRIASLSFF
jgi:uridine monophosphate synthetase